MARVKIHISIDAALAADPKVRARVLEAARGCGVSGINEQRFERYGILTGMAEDDVLDALRAVPGVGGVEVDQRRGLR